MTRMSKLSYTYNEINKKWTNVRRCGIILTNICKRGKVMTKKKNVLERLEKINDEKLFKLLELFICGYINNKKSRD